MALGLAACTGESADFGFTLARLPVSSKGIGFLTFAVVKHIGSIKPSSQPVCTLRAPSPPQFGFSLPLESLFEPIAEPTLPDKYLVERARPQSASPPCPTQGSNATRRYVFLSLLPGRGEQDTRPAGFLGQQREASNSNPATRQFLPEVWAHYGIGVSILALRFAVRFRTVGFRGFQMDDLFAFIVLIMYTCDAVAVHLVCRSMSTYLPRSGQPCRVL